MGIDMRFFTESIVFERVEDEDEADLTRFTDELRAVGAEFHRRGWVPASTGNFSARIADEPFRVLITKKVVDKGALTAADFVVVDETGATTKGSGCPSAETAIHLAIMRATGARAVLHTHSMEDVLISERNAPSHGVWFSGYEMLKALAGIRTHLHREWIPVLENSQDYRTLSGQVHDTIARHPQSHGFFLRAHGLYSWGADIAEARRHVEAVEFLAEATVKMGNMCSR
jgi:methylthioribulose-1-phosphate dehydratase